MLFRRFRPDQIAVLAVSFNLFKNLQGVEASTSKPEGIFLMRTYCELLKDPLWIRKRKKIIKRDGYKCTMCGSAKLLRVHHTYYTNKNTPPWAYPDNSLLTLCNGCHEKYHKEHELTIQLHHNKSDKKKKPKTPKVKKVMSLKELYKIWEPRLKSKKYKLID